MIMESTKSRLDKVEEIVSSLITRITTVESMLTCLNLNATLPIEDREVLDVLKQSIDCQMSRFGDLTFRRDVRFHGHADFSGDVRINNFLSAAEINCSKITSTEVNASDFLSSNFSLDGRPLRLPMFRIGEGLLHDKDSGLLSVDDSMLIPDDYLDLLAENKLLEEENAKLLQAA